MTLLLALLLVPACKDAKPSGTDTEPGTIDTAETGGETGDTAVPCEAELVQTSPYDGQHNWYWRDPLELDFSLDPGPASFTLVRDEDGAEIPLHSAWGEGRVKVTLTPDSPLDPSTDYTLTAGFCGATSGLGFSTSKYGEALADGPAALDGRTWVVLLSTVDFTEPPGIGPLLSAYLDVPLLIGVVAAGDSSLDALAAQGYQTGTGDYKQKMSQPTWSFSGVDFTEQPFFAADAPEIDLVYSGIDIPITDFHLEGTFAADGSSIGGARIWGLGDTRYMAGLFNGDETDPEWTCDNVIAVAGVSCEPCPDGEPACLFLKGEGIHADEVEGLTLEQVE